MADAIFTAVRAMKSEGKTFKEIGQALGFSSARAHKILQNGYSEDNAGHPIKLNSMAGEIAIYVPYVEDRKKLRHAAAKRGMSLQQVTQAIIDAVINDDMVDAVLDDGGDA